MSDAELILRNLLDACERGRPLADIHDRLRVEVGRLDEAGPQATPGQVLAEHTTITGPNMFDQTNSHLGINLDVPPGTHVRVVAAPTGQDGD